MPTRANSPRTKRNSSSARASRMRLTILRCASRGWPVFRRRQLHQDVLRASRGHGAAEFHLHHFRVFEPEAEALRQVAREVIAADPDRRCQVHGVAVVDHQFGGLRADIDHRDAFAPILRQHRRIAGGQRLEDRLLHREVRLIDRADERLCSCTEHVTRWTLISRRDASILRGSRWPG